jgi:hypothetical protein
MQLPLDQMTVEDKLRAIEMLWEDLLRNSADIPMPQWHHDELRAREQRVEQGLSSFSDWREAKQRIQHRTR